MVALEMMRSNLSFTWPASRAVEAGEGAGVVGAVGVPGSTAPAVRVPVGVSLVPPLALPAPEAAFLPEAVQPITPRPAISKLTQATMRTALPSVPPASRKFAEHMLTFGSMSRSGRDRLVERDERNHTPHRSPHAPREEAPHAEREGYAYRPPSPDWGAN